MLNKKIMILAIFLVSLLAVSAVSAADNATEDIVGVEETTDEVVSVDEDNDNNVNSSVETYENNEFLVPDEDSMLCYADTNNILKGVPSPHYNKYSVSVSVPNYNVYYGKDCSLALKWTSASGYVYKYDFYVKVYDSNNAEKFSHRFYGNDDPPSTGYLGMPKFNPGIYTVKIINTQDNYVKDTAILTIYSVHYSAYSVAVPDTYIDYEHSGSISISISPASEYYYYAYDFYLKVYDSKNNVKINQRVYSNNRDSVVTFNLNSKGWDLGKYKIVIINNIDEHIMSTANLTIASVPYSAYSVNVSDIYANYGTNDSILMSILPASNYTYKYDFYLKVYDSGNNLKINKRYYSSSPVESISYALYTSLDLGNYRIIIVNTNDNHVMGTANLIVASLPHSAYSVNVSDTVITYDDYCNIIMNITPANSSYYFKYDFYLKIYDSKGNEKFSHRYYSHSSTSQKICEENTLLEPGIYTIKLLNNLDNYVMSVANLTVIPLTSTEYSVIVSDTIFAYNDGGNIIMNITPSSAIYSKKYDFYLNVYDSNGNLKISQRYHSSDTNFQETYSGGRWLDSGVYTIKIINCYDDYVMDTAKLTVIALTSDAYSVNISDTIITYNVGGGIIMNITPPSSIYVYKYDYYLKVYDSNGNQKISLRYYSTNSDTQIIYSINSTLLSCGNYTIKLVNYYDNNVMSAANLYVVSVPHEAYSVSINNTRLDYRFSGSIIMNIVPANSSYNYKYDYYLKIYDSNDNEKISTRYYSTNSFYQEKYSFSSCYLTPGMYTIKILNNIDNYVMSTANLTVIALTSDAYSVNISDIAMDYGKSGSIIMNIVPANSSYNYKYDYYLKVYDSNGNQKINQRYYDTNSISHITYYINSKQLDPGNYTIKIINGYDNHIMSTSKLTVISIPYSVYSVNVSDIRLNYGNKGFISMSISPTSGYYYKYDFYLNVYDSEGYEKISKRYYSTSSSSQINYLLDSTELSSGIYTIKIINNVDDHVMSTAKLYVLSSPEFELFSQDYFVDEIVEIDYNIDPDATGTVSVYINGILIKNVSAGKNIELGYMPFGNYTINVIYDGDDYYYGQEDSTTFEVHRHCSTLILSVNNITVTNHDFKTNIVAGTDVILQFRFNEDINGKINVTHESGFGYKSNYTLDLVTGKANLPISNITKDYHLFAIDYAGDDKYLPFYAEYGLIFNPKQSYINYTIPDNLFWGDSFIINPILPEDATGEIDITIYDENRYHFNYSMNVNSTYNMTIYNGGYNYLALHYYGDEYYGNYAYLKVFNVAKLDTAFSITDNIEAGFSTINVTLNEDATGSVSLDIDYNTYPSTLKNGSYVVIVPDIKAGNYTVHIYYSGDSKYNPFIVYKPLKVNLKKTNLNLDLKNIIWGDNPTINPTISEGATGYIDIYVDDIFRQTIDVGSDYVLSPLYYDDIGKHEVKVVYLGDDYFQSCENTTSFWVFYQQYPIHADDTYIIYNTSSYFKAKFYDEWYHSLSNKYVVFNVAGNDYVRLTDRYGEAILDIDLDIGIYNVTSINPIYNENMTNKLVVFSSVQSENLTRAYNSGADFNATFLDDKAKPLSNTYVVFKVNGTDYTVKTNMYGQAVLNQGLAVGTYEVISINTYTSENKTNYLTIVPSIQAEDMLRAYNSTMDYCATFTCANNTPLSNTTVTFEIGSNRYEVSTDENGVAILNVPLAVGEYNITATNPVTGEKSTKNLTIVERIINNTNIVLSTDSEDYFRVVVIGDNGTVCKSNETVVFTLNNTNYNVKTDEYGYASLLISSLDKGLYQINTTYKGFTVSNNITVFEDLESIISIEVIDVNYTEKVCFNVSVSPEYGYGNLTIDIISNYETLFEFNTTANETFTKELYGLNASYYVIAVKFVDMDNYYISQDVLTFEVLKIDPKLIVVIDDAEYGQNATITVNIPQVSGNVTIRVGDEKNFTDYMPKDGVIIKRVNDLAVGEYDVIVTYEGDNNYNSLTKVSKLNINKIPTYIWLDSQEKYDYGQTITVNLMSSVDGVVKVEFGEDVRFIDVKANEMYQSNYSNCRVGVYLAVASLIPNEDYYDNSSTNTTIIVTKSDTIIYAPDITVAYKDSDGVLVATVISEYGKPLVVNLNFNFNGKDYTVKTDSNGRASIPIGTLSPGKYTATILYKGSSNYNASMSTANVVVTKAATVISAPDVNIAYKDPNSELVATIINEHGKTLVVNLNIDFNGKTYTVKTDSDGKASIPIGTLSPGTYAATISYKGSSNYKASSTTAKVTVTKASTVISASDVSLAYKDPNGELVATIISEHGKPLVVTLNVNLNGKTYTAKTDSNGQARIAVDTLTPGTYTATVSYKGSGNYKASSTTAKVTVTKAATVISASDVSIAYKDPSGELVANIVSEHGKPLVVNLNVNINGKDYTIRTDSNGQARIAVDTLTPGTYTATISYKGSGNYKASSTTAKVTVTKAATIISAPDVTVAYNDPNGKLVSTITNEHGKPLVVNLNVDLNGKTYSVKTDSNGQASVSTANLAPGTYTAAISYKGSGNYKVTSTTAKITVKR